MERKHRVSMVEVARAAGVSQSTASRALSGAPKVSSEARKAVEEAAATLGYVRDLRAADLARTRSATMGLLVRGTARVFYGELAASIQAETDTRDVDLLIASSGDDESRQMPAVRNLLGHGASGILIASGRASAEVVEYAAAFVPTVTIALGLVRPGFDAVNIDSASETDLAARVAQAGHRHVVVTASQNPLAYTLHTRTSNYLTRLIVDGVRTTIVAMGPENEDGFRADLRAELDAGATAVMTGDDAAALRVLEYLQDWGLRCPEDISVTGFDGVGAYSSPLLGITTVLQPVADLAAQAVHLMQQRIDGQAVTSGDIRVPGRFVPGRTLGPARNRDS